ncbi:MAG: FAD-dependent thymidylate synthase [Bifidobacteriaceae bacterium]|jgi:thymidylate synthase (FAD)|nr:FAD-dependent thymidylate synthase [Bifidobacteriaceae bacterium]
MEPRLPKVHLISRPALDWPAIDRYLASVGAPNWVQAAAEHPAPDGQRLVELMGRICYRSWSPGLNPNVSRVRTDHDAYLANILDSGHGSVLEHANYTFIFQDVSRVLTHELVRHRAGVAVSQESLRYVRLEDIPFDHPEYVRQNPELLEAAQRLLAEMERFQVLSAELTGIGEDGVSFHAKKAITSAARRYAPEGVLTTIGWTVNVRALRHVIALRTAPGAEDEIRALFGQVAALMRAELPGLFSDFTPQEDGSWIPAHPKV